jgi:hypothetical protein
MSLLIESKPCRLPILEKPEVTIRPEKVSVRYRVPHERVGTFKEYAIRTLQRRVNHESFGRCAV